MSGDGHHPCGMERRQSNLVSSNARPWRLYLWRGRIRKRNTGVNGKKCRLLAYSVASTTGFSHFFLGMNHFTVEKSIHYETYLDHRSSVGQRAEVCRSARLRSASCRARSPKICKCGPCSTISKLKPISAETAVKNLVCHLPAYDQSELSEQNLINDSWGTLLPA